MFLRTNSTSVSSPLRCVSPFLIVVLVVSRGQSAVRGATLGERSGIADSSGFATVVGGPLRRSGAKHPGGRMDLDPVHGQAGGGHVAGFLGDTHELTGLRGDPFLSGGGRGTRRRGLWR